MTAGGARPGAGRPAGSQNRRVRELLEKVGTGETPAEFLTALYLDEGRDMKTRIEAARAVAPYVHSRPVQRAETVELALPAVADATGIAAASQAVLEAVCSGEISVSAGKGLSDILEAKRRAIETVELEARIAALESAKGMNG